MVIITDPAVAAQVQTASFPRHPFIKSFLKGILSTKSVFSAVGAEWQRQHSWFAPAFSMQHLLTLVPGMIEETMENLKKYAVSGQVFKMNDETSHLAIDIISRTVENIRLKSQSEYSPIQDAFTKAITWTAG
jgi:cytochrome P450